MIKDDQESQQKLAGCTKFQPVLFDADLFGSKTVPCHKKVRLVKKDRLLRMPRGLNNRKNRLLRFAWDSNEDSNT